MVALGIPGFKDFLFRRAGNPPKLECQRRNSLLDETVLVAADEAVVFRLLIRLHLHARECGDGANVVAQGGFIETLDFEVFQREKRQIHIHVEVGDEGTGDGGMRSKVL